MSHDRPSFEEIYMRMALLWARRSTCSRLQVGSVITSLDHRYVYGVGYNGGASGLENECLSLEPGQCGHLHSEINAIINCCALRSQAKNFYVTHLPCAMCCRAIINLGGVQRVAYSQDYRLHDGLELLTRAGIEIKQFEGLLE